MSFCGIIVTMGYSDAYPFYFRGKMDIDNLITEILLEVKQKFFYKLEEIYENFSYANRNNLIEFILEQFKMHELDVVKFFKYCTSKELDDFLYDTIATHIHDDTYTVDDFINILLAECELT